MNVRKNLHTIKKKDLKQLTNSYIANTYHLNAIEKTSFLINSKKKVGRTSYKLIKKKKFTQFAITEEFHQIKKH